MFVVRVRGVKGELDGAHPRGRRRRGGAGRRRGDGRGMEGRCQGGIFGFGRAEKLKRGAGVGGAGAKEVVSVDDHGTAVLALRFVIDAGRCVHVSRHRPS